MGWQPNTRDLPRLMLVRHQVPRVTGEPPVIERSAHPDHDPPAAPGRLNVSGNQVVHRDQIGDPPDVCRGDTARPLGESHEYLGDHAQREGGREQITMPLRLHRSDQFVDNARLAGTSERLGEVLGRLQPVDRQDGVNGERAVGRGVSAPIPFQVLRSEVRKNGARLPRTRQSTRSREARRRPPRTRFRRPGGGSKMRNDGRPLGVAGRDRGNGELCDQESLQPLGRVVRAGPSAQRHDHWHDGLILSHQGAGNLQGRVRLAHPWLSGEYDPAGRTQPQVSMRPSRSVFSPLSKDQ